MKVFTGIVKVVAGIFVGFLFAYMITSPKGVNLSAITTGTTTTFSSSTLSGTAAVIFNSNPSAQYRAISSRTGINMWVLCNSTSTGFKAGMGRLLTASATLELIEENGTMWCTDNMYGITDGGTGYVGTMER